MTISTTPPSIPASPTGLYADDITSNSYSIHWDCAVDHADGSQYVLYQNDKKGFALLPNSQNSITLYSKPAQTYIIYVTHMTSEGVESLPSNKISVTTLD
ncbi:hypothetical protein M2387_003021 [Klebsiella sp. BIGb0407]|nr:hypothetical protein [Klebsiella sp. BIGb0407]